MRGPYLEPTVEQSEDKAVDKEDGIQNVAELRLSQGLWGQMCWGQGSGDICIEGRLLRRPLPSVCPAPSAWCCSGDSWPHRSSHNLSPQRAEKEAERVSVHKPQMPVQTCDHGCAGQEGPARQGRSCLSSPCSLKRQ